MRRRQPWLPIVIWIAVAATATFAVPEAMTGRSHLSTTVVEIEFWMVWAAAWLAILIPRTGSLTGVRILVPASIVASIATLVAGASIPAGATFVASALLATLVILHGSTSDAFVDGSSYGPERRFALRVPPLVAVTAVPVTWIVATIGLAAPPLLAARLWIPGAIVVLTAVALSRFAVRSIHGLSRRWIVFVPAGMVIHDPLTLTDAMLLARRSIVTLGPALAETDATDLSHGALGLSLQVDVVEPVGLNVRQGRSTKPVEVMTDRMIFTPLRPGALLESAREHRIPIGTPSATERPVTAYAQTDGPACAVPDPDELPDSDESTHSESQTAVPLPRTRSSR